MFFSADFIPSQNFQHFLSSEKPLSFLRSNCPNPRKVELKKAMRLSHPGIETTNHAGWVQRLRQKFVLHNEMTKPHDSSLVTHGFFFLVRFGRHCLGRYFPSSRQNEWAALRPVLYIDDIALNLYESAKDVLLRLALGCS